jgi:hypothetical protein
LYKCSNSCLWCNCWWNLDFSFKSYGKESLYKYCMNVDDGRIMHSWHSCLLTIDLRKTFNFNKGSWLCPIFILLLHFVTSWQNFFYPFSNRIRFSENKLFLIYSLLDEKIGWKKITQNRRHYMLNILLLYGQKIYKKWTYPKSMFYQLWILSCASR